MFKAIKRFLGFLLLLILVLLAGLTWRGWDLYREVIEEQPLSERVNTVRLEENYTSYEDLPQTYINAVVAIEDIRFWVHPGVDPVSIGRALGRDIREREWVEGGSTITQQLAKNLCFDQDKRLTRKVAEMFAAFALEHAYSKREIFELYVNSIYFGNGWYCVYDASVGYFGAEPWALSDYQCTKLACYPNAPSVFMDEENEAALEERRQEVVSRMVESGCLSEEEAAALR